jgi:hypothetical protein
MTGLHLRFALFRGRRNLQPFPTGDFCQEIGGRFSKAPFLLEGTPICFFGRVRQAVR